MAEAKPYLAAQSGELRAGDVIGRYRIDRIMGRGGMGTVYKAFDATTNRFVALKVLAPGLSDAVRSRFLAEGEAQAKIRHEHVMPVYDRGWLPDERPYFVMELVYEPLTLGEVLDRLARGNVGGEHSKIRSWDDPRKLFEDVLIPICEGVDVANKDYATIHRDVKPDNVLIDVRTRRPYLIDFGICHRLGETVDSKKIVGTPRFISPEQALARVDERTDVFGLGALLMYVLTGEPPIPGAASMTREEKVQRIASLQKAEGEARAKGDTGRTSELAARRATLEDSSFRTIEDMLKDAREGRYLPLPSTIPAALQAIVRKAMAREPAARYERARDLASDLKAWLSGGSVVALSEQAAGAAAVDRARRALLRNVLPILLVVAGLVVGGVLGMLAKQQLVKAPPPGLEHAREDLSLLSAPFTASAGPEESVLVDAVEWDLLQARLRSVENRLAGVSGADAERGRLEEVRARRAPAKVAFRASRGGTWVASDRIRGNRSVPLSEGTVSLAPGLYGLVSASGRAFGETVRVPAGQEVALVVDAPPTFPEWLAHVPAGTTPVAEDGAVASFLMARREVTNDEWADFLVTLHGAERERHVPATGFVRIGQEGRFGPQPGYEQLPVVGVRPKDAAAYASWRSEVEERVLRLPTVAEWRRAAGITVVWSLLRRPPEIATAADGSYAVMGRAEGGVILPLEGSLRRADPAPADERADDATIRLVAPLE